MRFGLATTTINRINEVLAFSPCVREAIIYGSRAKGTYRAGSDIDLTLKGENLTLDVLNRISMQLDALSLPYIFDLSVYERIKTPELIAQIKRVGKLFYSCRSR